jgi:hypothetical protein
MADESKVEIVHDGRDMFVFVDGIAVARRGYPGTSEAGTWISLKAGWTVTSNDGHSEIEIMHDGTQVH